MAQFESPNILGNFLTGQQAGQEQRRRKTLSDFLQPALGGDQGALSQVYAADPDAGLQVQGMAQKQQAADHDQKMGELEMVSRAWQSMPQMRQQLYPTVVELTGAVMPQFAGKIPREYNPAFEANIDKFLSGFAGGEQEQFTLAPGSTRYGADGRVIASQPFAPEKQDFVLSPDGTQWLPKPMGMPSQGVPAAAGPMMGQAFYDEVGKLISPYGATVGSTNGGEHNQGSLHYDGRALDIPLGASATDAVRANADRIIADLTNRGYTVRDERNRPAGQKVWGGPHLHVEAPSQTRASNGGAIPIPGARPRESEENFSQPQVVTNPQTGKQELVQFGNRGGRRVVSDYTPGPTDRDAKPPTEGERKAATLLARLNGSLAQLNNAVSEDKGASSPSVLSEVVRNFPLFGNDTAANMVTGAERQRVEAAQLDILDAALTLGTGAAYTREQLEGYRRSYFPQIGDSEATIEDKKARLANVIEAARIAAGRAAPADAESAGASSNGWSIKVKP